jgi:hypothetical protein
MTYAFTFDASACSGCKACQEACKDKNNLPVGVMWRRVVEVSGGGWHPVGGGSCAGIGESDESWRPAHTAWKITFLPTTCPLRAIIVHIQNARACARRMRLSTVKMGLCTLTRPNVWDADTVLGLARTPRRATTLSRVKWRSAISVSIILTRGCLRLV